MAIWPKPFCFSPSGEAERVPRIKSKRLRNLVLDPVKYRKPAGTEEPRALPKTAKGTIY
jgi:hypothetical protein